MEEWTHYFIKNIEMVNDDVDIKILGRIIKSGISPHFAFQHDDFPH